MRLFSQATAGMELIRGIQNLRPHHRGCVATIGNYDGIHVGHQHILTLLADKSSTLGVPSTVVSFEPTAKEFFSPDSPPARLTSFREKFELLSRYRVERFLVMRFDDTLANYTPKRFIDELLVNGLGIRYLVIGHDFRFASRRSGNFQTLREAGRRHNFGVDSAAAVLVDGERVSSNAIRAALAQGDLDKAASLLGRPYRISGRVVEGRKLGRELGFPTANLRLGRAVSPVHGIFAVRVYGVEKESMPAVASLGTRPTVRGEELLLEVYLFDFQGDLYRNYLHVDFVKKLREEERFPDTETLRRQMLKDAERAQAILSAH